ncbi:MAG: glycosyltransferase family 39 protein, partial [Ktedonobacterales bacterium]
RLLWRIAQVLFWDVAVPVIIYITAYIPRWNLAQSLDLITDEGVYIEWGRTEYTLLLHGDLLNNLWWKNAEAPDLPKLLMGWGSFHLAHNNALNGWLLGARQPGVVLSAVFLALAYLLARPVFGKPAAALGALALALSPWLAYFSAIAYLDTYMLAFMTLAILLTWHAARRPWLLPLVGVLLGLGFASKYTAAASIVPIALYLSYYYFCVEHRRITGIPWQVLLVIPATLLALYIADPFIWTNPVTNLWDSIYYQVIHAADGHEVFWVGQVWEHVPPGLALYILLAKMSLVVTVPALLTLPYALWRVIRARRAPTATDDTAAFALFWLGGLLPAFSSLNIVVGTHYMLPLAPPSAFISCWALIYGSRWLTPRLVTALKLAWARLPERVAQVREQGSSILRTPQTQRVVTLALLFAVCLLVIVPPAHGLATVAQAEGYTSEWLPGENHSLQVAYPGYADAIYWIEAHSHGRTTVSLVGPEHALDYWKRTRQNLFQNRIRLSFDTPTHYKDATYIVWPMHLIQRQFPTPPDWRSHVVATIRGGDTAYCYILYNPHATA